MQPFDFYIINFPKIKTLFIKCFFAMKPIIFVNSISLIVTWNQPRSATRTFFAYGCSHCTCKMFCEYWMTHLGFRMRGCHVHYVYFSVDCIPYKLLLHFFTLQNSVEKKHDESQQIWFRTKQAVKLFKANNKDGFLTMN